MISKGLNLEASDFGKKWCIIGRSGSGKSYTARVVIEEGRALGVSFAVIDPQSAYENLEGFKYLHAKKITDPKAMGILAASTAPNIVISTKGMMIKEQQEFLKKFLEGYRSVTRKGIRTIIIDEAHKFAPEYEKAASKEEVRSMSQENRSDGLGFIAVEQRTQRLDKTVLSQADIMVLHSVTSKRDCMAFENYLENPKSELEIIRKLPVGSAYIVGFKKPSVYKIRAANSKHSGEAPKILLTEDNNQFNRYVSRYVRGRVNTMENVAKNDAVNLPVANVPGINGFMDLVGAGAKMSLGLLGASIVGAYASRMKSPVPVISTRTMASAATMIVAYTLYRKIDNAKAKDIAGYAAAGAAVHTAGSLAFDVLAAFNVQVPGFVNFALNSMTGVQPVSIEGSASNDAPDLNTKFA